MFDQQNLISSWSLPFAQITLQDQFHWPECCYTLLLVLDNSRNSLRIFYLRKGMLRGKTENQRASRYFYSEKSFLPLFSFLMSTHYILPSNICYTKGKLFSVVVYFNSIRKAIINITAYNFMRISENYKYNRNILNISKHISKATHTS